MKSNDPYLSTEELLDPLILKQAAEKQLIEFALAGRTEEEITEQPNWVKLARIDDNLFRFAIVRIADNLVLLAMPPSSARHSP